MAAACVALAACGSTTKPGRDGIIRGPAPYAALTSASEALKVVFDEVCVPTVLDGGDFVMLAKQRYMVEVKPARDATGQTNQSFRLASLGDVGATLWADGTCTISVERGETEAMKAQVLETLLKRGHTMKPVKTDTAAGGGVRTGYCNDEPRPLLLAIITPGPKPSKRPNIVVNLYRARGGASDICVRGENAPQTP
jgi:hypothetical protein